MTTEVQVSLITSASTTIAVLITAFFAWLQARRQASKLETVHTLVNSRMSEVLALNKEMRIEIGKLGGDQPEEKPKP